MRVRIYGAGSAGMHHAHAARELGWDVDIADKDDVALDRMKTVYADRYGEWDDEIVQWLWPTMDPPKPDLTVIATPPESHVMLALWTRGRVLIEKPVCHVGQIEGARMLRNKDAEFFVGYTHTLGAKLPTKDFDKLYVRWGEHPSFILMAHPWLTSIYDTYLGYWHRGGGALSEHSHGIHLWQHIARSAWKGEVVAVRSQIQYSTSGHTGYDMISNLTLTTDTGFVGEVMQDFISVPAVKQSSVGKPGPRDFKAQLLHCIEADPEKSPLSLNNGLKTAAVIVAAHKSARDGGTVGVADIYS